MVEEVEAGALAEKEWIVCGTRKNASDWKEGSRCVLDEILGVACTITGSIVRDL
jgi:hypothetical protein